MKSLLSIRRLKTHVGITNFKAEKYQQGSLAKKKYYSAATCIFSLTWHINPELNDNCKIRISEIQGISYLLKMVG